MIIKSKKWEKKSMEKELDDSILLKNRFQQFGKMYSEAQKCLYPLTN